MPAGKYADVVLHITMNNMTKETKTEILVVDDHFLILEGICRLVNGIPGMMVADAATTGKRVLELVTRREYDIYILDISLPDMSGFDLVVKIRELHPDARIIVYTMHEEIWFVNRLVQCKVNAVVLKSSEVATLAEAIRCVLMGEPYACPRFASIRKRLYRTPASLQTHWMPTRREQDVLQAVARGMNTHEIAKLLEISENTVETFRRRLISKFEAKNAIDMVVKAVSRGWVIVE